MSNDPGKLSPEEVLDMEHRVREHMAEVYRVRGEHRERRRKALEDAVRQRQIAAVEPPPDRT